MAHKVVRDLYGQEAVNDPEDKNELFLIGYMESDRIDWHDDGEPGLGGTVGTYSLGADATMHLRHHYRIYSGVTRKTHFYIDKPPVPGCQDYQKRFNNYERFRSEIVAQRTNNPPSSKTEGRVVEEGKADAKQVQALRKEIGQQLDLHFKENPPKIIELKLRHGDMVFMVGRAVQEYFEVRRSGGQTLLCCRAIILMTQF